VEIGGKKVKKSTVLIVGAAGVGVVAVAVIRRKSAAAAAGSSAGSTTAAMVTDPAGNQCATLDASTGFCPGTPEDISAQEQLAAGSASYGTDSGGAGVYTPPSLYGDTTGTSSAVPVFTDNGSWAQYVEQALGSDGTDAIAAAIAKYLSGQSVTSAQQTTIEQAIAIANYPPVSGPGGFPPSMNLQASTPAPAPAPTPTPTPTPTAAQVTVPSVIGERGETAHDTLTGAGFKVTQNPPATPQGKTTTVTSQAPDGGKKAAKGSTVTIQLKVNE
jgi:hypothetical protein